MSSALRPDPISRSFLIVGLIGAFILLGVVAYAVLR